MMIQYGMSELQLRTTRNVHVSFVRRYADGFDLHLSLGGRGLYIAAFSTRIPFKNPRTI